jgi:hypothetical protein
MFNVTPVLVLLGYAVANPTYNLEKNQDFESFVSQSEPKEISKAYSNRKCIL